MANSYVKVLCGFLVMFALVGCDHVPGALSWSEYQHWLQKEEGLRKTKKINRINISTQFLPSDYLALRDLLDSDAIIDSTNFQLSKANYHCGLTFRILLEPEQDGISLLYHQVADETDYKQRVNALSFKGSEFIKMTVGEQSYPPVLVSYEGYNEMLNRLIFTTVFQPDEFNCGSFETEIDKVSVTFDDPFWSTGVNHFSYGTSVLTNVPQIILN